MSSREKPAAPSVVEATERIPSGETSRPRLLYLVFCDWYNRSQENKANLIGVFDQITVSPDATHTHSFWLCFRTLNTIGSGLRIVVFSPQGVPVATIRFEGQRHLDAPEGAQHYYEGAIHGRFPIATDGLYWLGVFFDDEFLGGNFVSVKYSGHIATEAANDNSSGVQRTRLDRTGTRRKR